jgi:hypothetical protein
MRHRIIFHMMWCVTTYGDRIVIGDHFFFTFVLFSLLSNKVHGCSFFCFSVLVLTLLISYFFLILFIEVLFFFSNLVLQLQFLVYFFFILVLFLLIFNIFSLALLLKFLFCFQFHPSIKTFIFLFFLI